MYIFVMKKLFISSLKYLGAIIVLSFISFSMSIGAKAASPKDPPGDIVCEFELGSKIVCKYGGLPGGAWESTIDLGFNPEQSKQKGYPVFNGNKVDFNLLFAANDATQAQWVNDDGYISQTPVKLKFYSKAELTDGDKCTVNKPNDCYGSKFSDYGEGKYTGGAYSGKDQFMASISGNKDKESVLSTCNNDPKVPLSFILCPILDGINNVIASLIGGEGQVSGERKGLLISFLQLPPLQTGTIQGQAEPVVNVVVQNMIIIANVFYIFIFLLLIFGSSIPFMSVDSYTIKKTLPKLIAAVILTQFALPICGVIIDFFNLLGQVVPNILFALTNAATVQTNATAANIAASNVGSLIGAGVLVGAGVAIYTFGWLLLLVIAIVALVAAVLAIAYMLLRMFFLYILVIISPIAFACWVLPNTEKVFKQWWSNFIKLNAMFVTITGLLSISVVLAKVFANVEQVGGLLSAVIPIIGLMLVPKTLKWTTKGMNAIAAGALGAVGAVGGKAAGTAKSKVTGAAKEFAGDQRSKAAAAAFGKGNKKLAAMLGGSVPTKRSQFLAGQKASAYTSEQRKMNAESLEYQGSRMAHDDYVTELGKLARGEDSKLNNGKKGDRNMRIAAGNILAQQGEVDTLRQMRLDQATTGVDDIMLGEMIQPSFSDIKAKAPELTNGMRIKEAYQDISAEKMLGLDKTSWDLLIQQTRINPVAKANFRSQMQLIHQDPKLRAGLSGEIITKLNNVSIPDAKNPGSDLRF